MKITYDAEVDMAYIALKDIAPGEAARSQEQNPLSTCRLVLDFDVDQQLIGIEVFDAKATLPPQTLAQATALSQQTSYQQCRQCELAFQALEAEGVPRGRARSVHNGIGVLASRLTQLQADHDQALHTIQTLTAERAQVETTSPLDRVECRYCTEPRSKHVGEKLICPDAAIPNVYRWTPPESPLKTEGEPK